MINRWVPIGIVCLLALSTFRLICSADEILLPAARDWELRVAGTGSSVRGTGRTTFDVSGSLGYFLNRFFEISLRQEVMYFSDSNDHWAGGTHGGLDFNIPLGRFEPYIGISIGHLYGASGLNEAWETDQVLGLKYYVQPRTFMYFQTAYRVNFENVDQLGRGFENGVFAYSLGIGFNF